MEDKVLFHMVILLVLVALVSTSCTCECVKPPPSIEVSFRSYHGRYVTARGEDDGWALRQDTELGECGRFIQHHLANGRVALETCYGRYVTAPNSGNLRLDAWARIQAGRLWAV